MTNFYDNLKLIKKGLDIQSYSLVDETTTVSTKDYNAFIDTCNNVVNRINLYIKVYNYFSCIKSFDAIMDSKYCHNITVYDVFKLIDKRNAIDVAITEHYTQHTSFFIIDIYS
jgi:hypothetical protein